MHYAALQLLLSIWLLETVRVAVASPQYQYAGYNPKGRCDGHYVEMVENQQVVEQWFDPWSLASGIMCHSNNDAPCVLNRAYTFSRTTAFSIGLSLQLKTKISANTEVAPTLGFGWSWSTTKGEATSSSQPCAKGDGIVCGLQFRPKLVKISADYYKIPDKNYGDCGDTRYDQKKLEIISSVVYSTTRSAEERGDSALVEFEACIMSCDNDEACWKAHQSGNSLCPGTAAPSNWGKQPQGGGSGNGQGSGNGNGNGNGSGVKQGCSQQPGEQKGQCQREHDGRWNCVNGDKHQRCTKGTWTGLTSLPGGGVCDCGWKPWTWNPANPGVVPSW